MDLFQNLLEGLSKQGVLGLLLAICLFVIRYLYLKNQELWQALLEQQKERLADTKTQIDFVNSFRECMESVVHALKESHEEAGG